MEIVVVVSFLDEARYLPALLDSLAVQTRRPDRILLVDDGSSDASPEIARAFAADRPEASVLQRPPKPAVRDRLVGAPELRAFLWGVETLGHDYDVVVKMDADLRLTPRLVEEMERRLEADPRLGIAGTFLSAEQPDGRLRRERNPAYHARAPAKFYRRECLEQIQPLPFVTGWETIDEVKARMYGWRTGSFDVPGGEVIHLRPIGTHDGVLRGFRRDGDGAYRYGAHPLHVVLGAVNRARDRPYVLGAGNYLAGWALAGLRRVERAEREVRAHARREQVSRIRARMIGRTA